MPSATCYCSETDAARLAPHLVRLKAFLAKELSCDARKLDSSEVSVRVIVPAHAANIAELEVEIHAHAYPERVAVQDEICRAVKKFVVDCSGQRSVYVWLQSGELGHSTEE